MKVSGRGLDENALGIGMIVCLLNSSVIVVSTEPPFFKLSGFAFREKLNWRTSEFH